jgi:photosystem II stability/assembly factor-like uncharacterized protein
MNAKTFIATTGRGLARAERKTDGEWTVEFLLKEQDVRCLACDPLNPDAIYAGTQGAGVLRSDDRGKTWQPVGLAGQTVKALAASPHQWGTVYAGTKPPYLFVSRDGGENCVELEGFRRIPGRWWWFSPAEKPGTAYVQAIALSPTNPNVILAGIELGAVVRSSDGGRTWSRHRRGAVRDCQSQTGTGLTRQVGAAWPSVETGVKPGGGPSRASTDTTAGPSSPTPPAPKYGMPPYPLVR